MDIKTHLYIGVLIVLSFHLGTLNPQEDAPTYNINNYTNFEFYMSPDNELCVFPTPETSKIKAPPRKTPGLIKIRAVKW
jgi:hypothetical protein